MKQNTQEPYFFTGKSMHPTLLHSDQLAIEFFDAPRKASAMQAGEVVLIRNREEWVVHRIVERQGIKITKGDWSAHFDEECSIWGVVTQVNGRPSQLLRSPHISSLSEEIQMTTPSLLRKLHRIHLWTRVQLTKGWERLCW